MKTYTVSFRKHSQVIATRLVKTWVSYQNAEWVRRQVNLGFFTVKGSWDDFTVTEAGDKWTPKQN